MTDIKQIESAVAEEYQAIRGKPPQFDRNELPYVLFCLEDKPPSVWMRLKQKDFHSVMHKIFHVPFVGTLLHALYLLARLPHHIHKLRTELFELKMEFRKFEGQFSTDHRKFSSQTRDRFEKIEQTIKKRDP